MSRNPPGPENVNSLEELLSDPPECVVEQLKEVDGDLLVLGVAYYPSVGASGAAVCATGAATPPFLVPYLLLPLFLPTTPPLPYFPLIT